MSLGIVLWVIAVTIGSALGTFMAQAAHSRLDAVEKELEEVWLKMGRPR